MLEITVLIIAGFLSGAINSIAGGGALLAFPALLYAGLSPISATITGTLIVWPGNLSAAYANRKHIKKLPKKYFTLLIPCFVGGLSGILILKSIPSSTFNAILPWLILITVVIFILQPYMHSHTLRPPHMRPILSLAIVWLGVFLVSVYAGYFGLGAGLILLTLFGFTRIKTIYQMIGLKNLAGAIVTFTATILFATSDYIVWKDGLVMAGAAIFGGIVGTRFSHKIPVKFVRLIVAVVGIIVASVAFAKF